MNDRYQSADQPVPAPGIARELGKCLHQLETQREPRLHSAVELAAAQMITLLHAHDFQTVAGVYCNQLVVAAIDYALGLKHADLSYVASKNAIATGTRQNATLISSSEEIQGLWHAAWKTLVAGGLGTAMMWPLCSKYPEFVTGGTGQGPLAISIAFGAAAAMCAAAIRKRRLARRFSKASEESEKRYEAAANKYRRDVDRAETIVNDKAERAWQQFVSCRVAR